MTQISTSARVLGRFVIMWWIMGCGGPGQPGTPSPTPGAAESSTARSSPAPAPVPASGSSSWLNVDSAGRTATLKLEITSGGKAGLINGYRAGQATVVVPLGWTVRWNWRNADSSLSHSLVVMVQREKIPLEGGRPAFSNAMTRMVTQGLSSGQTDQTAFEADEAGWFWMLCGVPEHALEGEWIELRVDSEATTARVVEKRER